MLLIRSLAELLQRASSLPQVKVAVAGTLEQNMVRCFAEASASGIASAVFFVPQGGAAVDVIGTGEIVHCLDEEEACRRAVAAVRGGECAMALKGIAHTDTFLRAVLNKEYGLTRGRLISNVFAFEKPSGGLCLLTDPSIVISPTLEQKAQMIQNAVDLANDLGISRPRVAVIAAVETVTSSMPETIEAAALAKMAQRGQIKNCVVDGPLALDNAVSSLAARIKSINGEVAGDADILLCQHIVVANVLSKALAFYAGKELAANVVGTSCPTIIVSRADSPKTRLLSIALGKVRLDRQAR